MGLSVSDDVVPFVQAGEQDATEVDGPDPVVDLLESDVVLLQGIGDEQGPVLEAEGARVRDPLHEKVARILERRQLLRERPRRGPIERARWAAPEGLVGPLVVVRTRNVLKARC